jgi:hypothetical protein
MKITKQQLKRIIKEELENVLESAKADENPHAEKADTTFKKGDRVKQKMGKGPKKGKVTDTFKKGHKNWVKVKWDEEHGGHEVERGVWSLTKI